MFVGRKRLMHTHNLGEPCIETVLKNYLGTENLDLSTDTFIL